MFDKLLYRSQFILGPNFGVNLDTWKKLKINSSMFLTVHPDLVSYQLIHGDKSLTLLGSILDPDKPKATDSDIIDDLFFKLINSENPFDFTFKLGGRWVLIFDNGQEQILWHDAAGLRQVFYSNRKYSQDVWCSSQPKMIANLLNLELDREAVDFVESGEIRENREYWWPGDASPYKEIKRLLPNHYLDLGTGVCHRYWPDNHLRSLEFNDAVELIMRHMTGLIKSASNRFDVVISLTAGWDSRLVLAASKEISHRISYMTVKQLGMAEDDADIRIPSNLLLKLGLKHDILRGRAEINNEFKRILEMSLTFAHDFWAPDVEAIFEYYAQRKVVIVGSVSEVVRCKSKSVDRLDVTPEMLSSITGMGRNPFAIKSFQGWLDGVGEIYNLDILRLFHWEQRVGSWLSMCQAEFSMAWQDIFTPYNCRNLLINMLSVDEKYRRPPEYRLYADLILRLWPEVLCEPINPPRKRTLKGRMKNFVKRLKLPQ